MNDETFHCDPCGSDVHPITVKKEPLLTVIRCPVCRTAHEIPLP